MNKKNEDLNYNKYKHLLDKNILQITNPNQDKKFECRTCNFLKFFNIKFFY